MQHSFEKPYDINHSNHSCQVTAGLPEQKVLLVCGSPRFYEVDDYTSFEPVRFVKGFKSFMAFPFDMNRLKRPLCRSLVPRSQENVDEYNICQFHDY